MIITFQKGAEARFIGHLDLMRTMQRALRRSGLPVRYSKGFSPHMLLSFASPLSVGVVGLREAMDVPVEGEPDAEAFRVRLNEMLPACLRAVSARRVNDDFPTLMALVGGAEYRIDIPEEVGARAVSDALASFLALGEYVADRKTKSGVNPCDIRPMLLEARVEDGPSLWYRTENGPQGWLKPDLLWKSLCALTALDPPQTLFTREKLLCRTANGGWLALEDYGRG